MSGTVDFKGDCGEASDSFYSARSPGMQPGQSATINGSPPGNCIIGNDGAQVQQIEVVNNAGFYSYQIRVNGRGPSGIFGGSFYLSFQDQSGDIYTLSIYSSDTEWHTVSYNSSNPAITLIAWSDNSFTIDDNAKKTKFKVVSPDESVN